MKHLFAACLILGILKADAQNDTIWFLNFNDSTLLPSTWSQSTFSTNGGWVVGSTASVSSGFFGVPAADGNVLCTNDDACNCDHSADTLFAMNADLVNRDNPYVTFQAFYLEGAYAGFEENFKVLTSINGGIDWVEHTIISGATSWQSYALDLSEFAGGDVQLAFVYSDGGGWLFGAAIDNVAVVDLDTTLVNAALSGGNLASVISAVPTTNYQYYKHLVNEELIPSVTITNELVVPITDLEIKYTFGAEVVTETVTGIYLSQGGSYVYDFTQPITVPLDTLALTFDLLSVNGLTDAQASNNTTSITVYGIQLNANKKVVVEEGTGTWCGFCPKSTVYLDFLEEKYPDNFIALSVHNADPMVVAEYDQALGNNISGYPAGMVDRASFEGANGILPQNFERAVLERISTNSGTTVSVAADLLSDLDATVIVNVNFAQTLSSTYKVAVVIVEDEVAGTGNSWAQQNDYAGGAYGPMGGYENLAAVIPANSISYNRVVRAIIGGFSGSSAATVTSPVVDSTYNFAFNAPLNAGWDVENLRVVALFINSLSGEIINAGISETLDVSVKENTTDQAQFKLYPNPANEVAYLKLNNSNTTSALVRIADATGKVVFEQAFNALNANALIQLNTAALATGFYSVAVIEGSTVSTKTLVVSK